MAWRSGDLSRRDQLDADAAVADEAARLAEHRLAAYPEALFRAVGIDAVEEEIQERLAVGDGGAQHFALRLVPARRRRADRISHEGLDPHPEHLQDRAGGLGESPVLVLLPVPVGRELGQAA